MKTLQELNLRGKRVFVRCDYDVPMKNGKVTNTYRVDKSLSTIKYILKQKPKQLILAAHAGRPKGVDASVSLAPIAKLLTKLLKKTVYLQEDILSTPNPSQHIVLLENLRFHPEEKENKPAFAKQLANYCDVYVNNAFAVSHRKHASMVGIPKYVKQKTMGLTVQTELENVHLNHKKPIVAIFGAAKLDKLPVLKQLLTKVDKVLLCGGVVFTFLRAAGIEIGKSLVEDDMVPTAKQLLKKYSSKIVFPTDFTGCALSKFKTLDSLNAIKKRSVIQTVDFDAIPKSLACFDVGPKSVTLFKAVLSNAKTVVWNGPLGYFELKPFDKSTNAIIAFIAQQKLTCIVGGGDTASAVLKTKYADKITHISTGGGASLELLAGKKLPAISVLEK